MTTSYVARPATNSPPEPQVRGNTAWLDAVAQIRADPGRWYHFPPEDNGGELFADHQAWYLRETYGLVVELHDRVTRDKRTYGVIWAHVCPESGPCPICQPEELLADG